MQACSTKANRVQCGVPAVDLDFKVKLFANVLGEVAICDGIRHILVLDGASNVARAARGVEPARHAWWVSVADSNYLAISRAHQSETLPDGAVSAVISILGPVTLTEMVPVPDV